MHSKYLGDHRDTAVAHKKLGSLYNVRQEFEKAKKQFEAALQINTSLYGPTHPRTCSCQDEIGNLMMMKKDYQVAANIFQDVIDKREAVLNSDGKAKKIFDSPQTILESYRNLALALRKLGKDEEADDALKKSNHYRLNVK